MSEMAWMHSARIVVEERSARWVHPYSGAILEVPDENNLPTFSDDQGVTYPAVLLDMQTAYMLDQVWRNLSPKNQAEFAEYGLAGAVEFGGQILTEARIRTIRRNSMSDYITLGPTPSDEPCAQVGEELYAQKARAECRRFIKVLRETFGPEPSGAYLMTKGFEHDFGVYYEVVCHFNPEVPESREYAMRCEDEAPTTWPDDPLYNGSAALCPECGEELELGTSVQLFSFIQGDTYRCHTCKLLFAHDLTVLARMEG